MWKFVYSPSQTLNSDWYKACIIIAIEKIHITRTVLNERATTTNEREPKLTILLKNIMWMCACIIFLLWVFGIVGKKGNFSWCFWPIAKEFSIHSYKLKNDVNRVLTTFLKKKDFKTECGMKNYKIKIKNDTRLSSEMPIFYCAAFVE